MRTTKQIGYLIALLSLTLGSTYAGAEAVAVISTKNPVTSLTLNQLTDIFLGKANRFPNGEIVVPINQPEGTAVRDEFYTKVAGKSPAQIKAHWSKVIFTGRGQPPREVANSNEAKKLLGNNPAAIGYIDKNDLDSSIKAVQLVP